jgi:hypothetical protein
MASTERFRYGHQVIIEVPKQASAVIEKGDFICLVSGEAVNALGVGAAANKAAAREAAADAFLGIAQNASAAADTDPILVDISKNSVYEFDLAAAAAVSIGDLLEIYAGNSYCTDQTMVAGSTSHVAVCVKDKAASGTKVLAILKPQIVMGAAQT